MNALFGAEGEEEKTFGQRMGAVGEAIGKGIEIFKDKDRREAWMQENILGPLHAWFNDEKNQKMFASIGEDFMGGVGAAFGAISSLFAGPKGKKLKADLRVTFLDIGKDIGGALLTGLGGAITSETLIRAAPGFMRATATAMMFTDKKAALALMSKIDSVETAMKAEADAQFLADEAAKGADHKREENNFKVGVMTALDPWGAALDWLRNKNRIDDQENQLAQLKLAKEHREHLDAQITSSNLDKAVMVLNSDTIEDLRTEERNVMVLNSDTIEGLRTEERNKSLASIGSFESERMGDIDTISGISKERALPGFRAGLDDTQKHLDSVRNYWAEFVTDKGLGRLISLMKNQDTDPETIQQAISAAKWADAIRYDLMKLDVTDSTASMRLKSLASEAGVISSYAGLLSTPKAVKATWEARGWALPDLSGLLKTARNDSENKPLDAFDVPGAKNMFDDGAKPTPGQPGQPAPASPATPATPPKSDANEREGHGSAPQRGQGNLHVETKVIFSNASEAIENAASTAARWVGLFW
jgi:hypothetical protein